MNDAIERDRELFGRVAETNPEIVRTIAGLVDELDAANLDAEILREVGDRIRRIGDTVIANADHITIDQDPA